MHVVFSASATVTRVLPTPEIVPPAQVTDEITDRDVPPEGEKAILMGFELAERGDESGSTMMNRLAGPSP